MPEIFCIALEPALTERPETTARQTSQGSRMSPGPTACPRLPHFASSGERPGSCDRAHGIPRHTPGGINVGMTDTNDNTNPSQGVTMTVNESNLDRAVRGGIAVTTIGAGTAIGGVLNPVGIALYGIGTVAAVTAVTGYCPLYSALGISTLGPTQES